MSHGFAIRELGIEATIPLGGEPVAIEFVATEAGRFPFTCARYCGLDHQAMTGMLTVTPRGAMTPVQTGSPQEAYPGQFEDLSLDLAEPDFTLVSLPTTLRLPRHRAAFRVTHRFTRPLGTGSVADLLQELFGLDSGALMGLELRVGIRSGTQLGVYRTSERSIEIFGQQNILRPHPGSGGMGLGILLAVEGLDNFRRDYSPAVGVIVSRTQADRMAFYLEPIWTGNSDVVDSFGRLADDTERNWTLMVGLGARIRVRSTVYLVGEFVPRFGFSPGDHPLTFGVEKRVGGHTFQLNVSNSIGQTLRQVARYPRNDWFIGFNITRKFF